MMEELLTFVIGVLLGLGCFGAAAWVALNPETLDVDKIFSIMACLLLGLVFLGVAAWTLFHTRLRELLKPAAASPEPQQAPAKQKAEAPEEAKKSAS